MISTYNIKIKQVLGRRVMEIEQATPDTSDSIKIPEFFDNVVSAQ